ncbi:MAG TPA: maleylacetoacetate isomerase [Gammaproteobacteria bacterium]|nr:maleylacetoacetate isomerase [Gammaproteobacteria bacterium]
MELYTYYRSIAAQRVRIALNLKGLTYESRFINLRGQNGGDQNSPQFRAVNPQGLAPVLVDEDLVITQSLAIIEYLEEAYPTRPLLPRDLAGRARVRSLAQLFASDIQPLNNLRVQSLLRDQMKLSQRKIRLWYNHWVTEGLDAAEILLSKSSDTGGFCHGEYPTVADVCLVPQVHDAIELDYDLSRYPSVRSIYRNCMTLASFQAATPETQPDAVSE